MNFTLRLSALSLIAFSLFAAAPDGQSLYESNCQMCHGKAGAGGIAGPSLHGKLKHGSDAKAIAGVLRAGISGSPMRAFSELSDAQRQSIARYVVAQNKTK